MKGYYTAYYQFLIVDKRGTERMHLSGLSGSSGGSGIPSLLLILIVVIGSIEVFYWTIITGNIYLPAVFDIQREKE